MNRPATSRQTRAAIYGRRRPPRSIELTERDEAVLAALAHHRMLSGDQLRRLVFGASASKCRRRLRALFDHGLLDRKKIVAVPTAGIPPFAYTLSPAGASLLREASATASSRASDWGLRYLHHRFLVNELCVALNEAARERGDRVVGWRHEEQLRVSNANGGPGGTERIVHPRLAAPASFLPDGYFELETGRGERYAFFVEVDRATHPLRVWRARAHLYAAYADPVVGLFRRRFGRETFRVLVLTPPDYRGRSRRDNILGAIRHSIGTSDMFLAATFAELRDKQILGRVWRAADGTERTHLLIEGVRAVERPHHRPRAVAVRATHANPAHVVTRATIQRSEP